MHVAPRFLPFADAASAELPLGRLLRLALFQISVGMAITLVTGTLNRVMILELSVPAWLVSTMIALPLLFAPLRALIGHKSDTHVSVLGWRRVPYIWFGSLVQFGGLAMMPFAILLMADGGGPAYTGHFATAAAFLFIGAGFHTTQTAGLALATDIAPEASRPRVVALLYVMLLVGMVASASLYSWLLADFSNTRLIQVIQGSAVVTIILNVIALWKQEVRQPKKTAPDVARPTFREAWSGFAGEPMTRRLLWAVGLGTLAFSLQDILLEPYGGEVLGLSVSATTLLTALFAGGMLGGFALAAMRLGHGSNPYRLAALGVIAGIVGFSLIVFSSPFGSALMFRIATLFVGFGSGLFAVSLLTATMARAKPGTAGMALGAWGAVNASAAGLGLAAGGALKDLFQSAAELGLFGRAITDPAFGYGAVYHIEVWLLFATLVALGPLVGQRFVHPETEPSEHRFGLAEFPS
ncbi:MAG: BCD family MFS transporter [Devosiaceae bacterium]|nr:BCD family MFS transporter [Devosiaceae bacterium MH13]